MRAKGTAINSHIVIGVGRGILLKCNKELLEEYGGPIALTKEWAKSKVFVSDFQITGVFGCTLSGDFR